MVEIARRREEKEVVERRFAGEEMKFLGLFNYDFMAICKVLKFLKGSYRQRDALFAK